MTKRRLVWVLVSAVVLTGTVIAIAVAGDSGTGESEAKIICPPARQVQGVVVSATRPLPDAAPAARNSDQLAFVANGGQADPAVRYYARGESFGIYITDDAIEILSLSGTTAPAVRLVPLDPGPLAQIEARTPLRGRTAYLTGRRRVTNLRSYAEVAYRELWPGIDLVLRGDGEALKYEFHVAPGADPGQIQLAYRNVHDVALGADGSLVVSTPMGPLRDAAPTTYQPGTPRVAVESGYALDERAATFGFHVGDYDRGRPLVIDPGLDYSVYVGGSGIDLARAVAVDADGNTYVAGGAQSADFPVTPNAPGAVYRGQPDAYVAKLDPSGAIVYSTYIGGSKSETALSIAVDDAGNAYVSGGSNSDDFPTTAGAFGPRHKLNEDAWVIKLDPTGSRLLYGGFLTGTAAAGDFATSLAVDNKGYAYVAGGTGSRDFPVTRNAFDRTHGGKLNELDGFVAKITPDGSALVFATYIGGTCYDAVNGLKVDGSGNVYVVGSSASSDFPTTKGVIGRRYRGGEDAFVAKLSSDGARLEYATFLGGSKFDTAKAVAVDRHNTVYVTGWTESQAFPTTEGAFDTGANGGEDAFVTNLSADATHLVYSTYLGGTAMDEGWGIAVDESGHAYVAGGTASAAFPTVRGAIAEHPQGGQDAFLAQLGPRGSSLSYSTYLGGSDLDIARGLALGDDGKVCVIGRTSSPNFPTAGVQSTALAGPRDSFVTMVRVR